MRSKNTLWLDDQFKYLTCLNCFWCDLRLPRKRATADHIVPQYLGDNSSDNRVVCCIRCNEERSMISTIASLRLRDFKFWSEGEKKGYWKRVLRASKVMIRFRKLIARKLTHEKRDVCLEEINLILKPFNLGNV